jgi:hypothetical protein
MVKKMLKSKTTTRTVEYMPVPTEPRPVHVDRSTRTVEQPRDKMGGIFNLNKKRKPSPTKNAEDFAKSLER